jgi:hypothetical protein
MDILANNVKRHKSIGAPEILAKGPRSLRREQRKLCLHLLLFQANPLLLRVFGKYFYVVYGV